MCRKPTQKYVQLNLKTRKTLEVSTIYCRTDPTTLTTQGQTRIRFGRLYVLESEKKELTVTTSR